MVRIPLSQQTPRHSSYWPGLTVSNQEARSPTTKSQYKEEPLPDQISKLTNVQLFTVCVCGGF